MILARALPLPCPCPRRSSWSAWSPSRATRPCSSAATRATAGACDRCHGDVSRHLRSIRDWSAGLWSCNRCTPPDACERRLLSSASPCCPCPPTCLLAPPPPAAPVPTAPRPRRYECTLLEAQQRRTAEILAAKTAAAPAIGAGGSSIDILRAHLAAGRGSASQAIGGVSAPLYAGAQTATVSMHGAGVGAGVNASIGFGAAAPAFGAGGMQQHQGMLDRQAGVMRPGGFTAPGFGAGVSYGPRAGAGPAGLLTQHLPTSAGRHVTAAAGGHEEPSPPPPHPHP